MASASTSSAGTVGAPVPKPSIDDVHVRARSLATKTYRPVFWHDDKLYLIDQRGLPTSFELTSCSTQASVAECISAMVVRGAPAIGAAGAYGVVIAARTAAADGSDVAGVVSACESARIGLNAARPTAVNLMWATERMVKIADAVQSIEGMTAEKLASTLLSEAHELCELDARTNEAISNHGAALVPDGANMLHHCNTGALATIDWGTALGVIYKCHELKKGIHVWVDETRPRLQGARLTAWELMRAGVDMHLIADGASGSLMRAGKVDCVVFGADRVAANGDTANKIGTYNLCCAANESGVPAYAVVPTSTIDLTVADGSDIPIEERGASEVTSLRGVPVAPEGCPVYNPAFDVTPAKFITGIITEMGVCYPPYGESLRAAKEAAEAAIAKEWETKLASLKSASGSA